MQTKVRLTLSWFSKKNVFKIRIKFRSIQIKQKVVRTRGEIVVITRIKINWRTKDYFEIQIKDTFSNCGSAMTLSFSKKKNC